MIDDGAMMFAVTAPPPPPPPTSVPPGWYPDPGQYGVLRWWDGARWTENVAHPNAPYAAPSQWSSPQHRDRMQEALLPVNRTGLSIAAGYAGLFAVLIIPAPIALVLGILALRDLRRKPGVGGSGRAWFGLIAGALGTVGLIAIIAANG